jgi:hypothetical protein
MSSQNPKNAYDQKVSQLSRLFRGTRDKYAAHREAQPILQSMAADKEFLVAALRKYISMPGVWNRGHYPVLGGGFELNPYFALDINIWIPLADKNSDLSTKAIHHHGPMILSTATIFGPGYDHWTFHPPKPLDPERELFRLEFLERAQHAKGQIAFVDANIAHVPFFPPGLSITAALWSNSSPTTWRDHAKRMPLLKGHAATLRKIGKTIGLTKSLDLKMEDYLDYYPTADGFKGMRQRKELELGPNENFVGNLFYVLQQTGSESLAPVIRKALDSGEKLTSRATIQQLLGDLESGRPISPRYSAGHSDVPHANFASAAIEQAFRAQGSRAMQKAADGQ